MSNEEAPQHLREKTAQWWLEVTSEFDLEAHHVRLLTLACESWDRGQAAREVLAEHGMTYTDRFDQPKSRPEVAIGRDARTQFARLLRELDLDHVTEPESRPPPIPSNKG